MLLYAYFSLSRSLCFIIPLFPRAPAYALLDSVLMIGLIELYKFILLGFFWLLVCLIVCLTCSLICYLC